MKKITAALFALAISITAFAQGKVEKIENFKSKYVKKRNVEVYLPATYFANPKQKFPVLYMNDGQNVFNPETSMNHVAWEADATADKLIGKKAVKPMIIVAVWNGEDTRITEYFPEKAAANFSTADKAAVSKAMKQFGVKDEKLLGDEYLQFLVEELKPYIDKKYRTLTDASNTAICGSSMGGLISMYAICEYPEVFGEAACLSTHWPILMNNDNMEPSMAIKQYVWEHLPDPRTHKLYFDYGTVTLDQYYEVHQRMIDDMLRKKGYFENKNWLTVKAEKAPHTEKAWQERFDKVLAFLFIQDKPGAIKRG